MSGFLTDKDGPYIISDPADIRDYLIDWTNVVDSTDVISTSTWEVPVGLVASSETITGKITGKRITGGRLNTIHRIYNTVTTTGGRRFRRSFRIMIKTDL